MYQPGNTTSSSVVNESHLALKTDAARLIYNIAKEALQERRINQIEYDAFVVSYLYKSRYKFNPRATLAEQQKALGHIVQKAGTLFPGLERSPILSPLRKQPFEISIPEIPSFLDLEIGMASRHALAETTLDHEDYYIVLYSDLMRYRKSLAELSNELKIPVNRIEGRLELARMHLDKGDYEQTAEATVTAERILPAYDQTETEESPVTVAPPAGDNETTADTSSNEQEQRPLPDVKNILKRFGGGSKMARLMDMPVETVFGWQNRGFIPADRLTELFRTARDNNIDIYNDSAKLDFAMPDAETVISLFNGLGQLAEKVELPYSTVNNWRIKNHIPEKHHQRVAAAAAKGGIDLKNITSISPAQKPATKQQPIQNIEDESSSSASSPLQGVAHTVAEFLEQSFSSAVQAVLKKAKALAPLGSRANILVSGETGTGKEVLSRYIHDNSPRAGKPFIAINCGAIPENLFEAEIFGAKKGAYTGAVNDRVGKIMLANQGTLLLDEIGSLPLDQQAKLLRVLQEQRICPLGGNASDEQAVDVRIIAASHENLEDLVKAGKFRQDLYMRLNVMKLDLPPLRNRIEDIPTALAFHLRTSAADMGLEAKPVSEETLDQLRHYPWPGNLRELANASTRALINAHINGNDVITFQDFELQATQDISVSSPQLQSAIIPSPALREHYLSAFKARKQMSYDIEPSKIDFEGIGTLKMITDRLTALVENKKIQPVEAFAFSATHLYSAGNKRSISSLAEQTGYVTGVVYQLIESAKRALIKSLAEDNMGLHKHPLFRTRKYSRYDEDTNGLPVIMPTDIDGSPESRKLLGMISTLMIQQEYLALAGPDLCTEERRLALGLGFEDLKEISEMTGINSLSNGRKRLRLIIRDAACYETNAEALLDHKCLKGRSTRPDVPREAPILRIVPR